MTWEPNTSNSDTANRNWRGRRLVGREANIASTSYAIDTAQSSKDCCLAESVPCTWQPRQRGSLDYHLSATWIQARLDEAKASLAKSRQLLQDSQKLVERKVLAQQALNVKQDDFDAAKSDVDRYAHELEQTVAVAPSNGCVINLQLRAGQFVRLKAPVMSFVSTDEVWLVMAIRQEGAQYVAPGQEVEFALRVTLDEQQLGAPMVFGASGLGAVNTGKGADIFWLLRRIEIQSESPLNYVYNPFRG